MTADLPPMDQTPTPPKRGRKPTKPHAADTGILGESSSPSKTVGRGKKADELRSIEAMLQGVVDSSYAMLALGGEMAQRPLLTADALAIQTHGPGIIQAVVRIAENDDKVRTFLCQASTSAGYAQLASAIVPLLLALLANHGMLGPLSKMFAMAEHAAHPVG